MFDTYLFAGEHLFLSFFCSTGSQRGTTTVAAAARPSCSSRVLSSGKIKNRGQYFTLAWGRAVFPMYASWNFYSNWMIVWGKVVYLTYKNNKNWQFWSFVPAASYITKENTVCSCEHTHTQLKTQHCQHTLPTEACQQTCVDSVRTSVTELENSHPSSNWLMEQWEQEFL